MALLLHGRKSGREDNIGGPQLPVKDGKANNKEEDRDRDEKRKEHGRPPEENMGERETGREVKEMGTQEAGWQEEAKGRSEEPETIKDKEKTAAYSHQRTGANGQGRWERRV